MLTLKQLADAAREEMGWSKPSSYAGSADDDAAQTFRIANRQGRHLADQAHPWEALKTKGTITLVAATQSYSLADDFRYLLTSTVWDTTNERIALGPLTPQEWARSQNSGVVFGLNWRFEIRGGNIVFDQTVTSGDAGIEIPYEYISSHWATSSGGDDQIRFEADTDTQKFDDDLFIEGLIFRLKKAKGFEWQADAALYQDQLSKVMSRDGGMRDVSLGSPSPALVVNIGEGDFG